MVSSRHDQVIALAGMFQAAGLVRDIAHTGRYTAEPFTTCISSLLKIDADSSEAVYGSMCQLAVGLRLLIAQMRQPSDMEITRYVLSLMVLERKLSKRPDLLRELQEGIEQARHIRQKFSMEHDDLTARLADLYSKTISTLKPRIMVNGAHRYLNQQENANRIRALLLAGIRAAVLWRQKKGGRMTLLFQRKALLAEAQSMLGRLPQLASADDA